MKIRFSPANSKLKKLEKKTKSKVYSFDILSGVSCPFAKDCHSWAKVQPDGRRKVVDGPHCKFRCYSASQEAQYPETYKYRKENSKILKLSYAEMVQTITKCLPIDADIIRIHASGDFNSQRYFDAWVRVAKNNPHMIFYAYTKALPYWIKRKSSLPRNLVLTASYGGTEDHLIKANRLRSVRVVMREGQRDSISHRVLPIDSDDSIAYNPDMRNRNFSLLIHGPQPAGTEAAKIVHQLKGVK